MRDDLAQRIAALPDTDLIRLLTVDAAQYRPDAIALGRLEADRRNLTVDASLLASPQPRPSFLAALHLSMRNIPRGVVLAACFGAMPFAATALLYLFGAGHLADNLLLLASAPGMLLGGLIADNVDAAFDTPLRCAFTLGSSWLFWAVLFRIARRLVAAVRRS